MTDGEWQPSQKERGRLAREFRLMNHAGERPALPPNPFTNP
jgi:hypothetical protein